MIIPLQVDLREGVDSGTDVLKVFGTIGTSDFRLLELPRIGQAAEAGKRKLSRGWGVSSELDELLATIAFEQPSTRNLSPVSTPSSGSDWVTAQVELRVRRPAPDCARTG